MGKTGAVRAAKEAGSTLSARCAATVAEMKSLATHWWAIRGISISAMGWIIQK